MSLQFNGNRGVRTVYFKSFLFLIVILWGVSFVEEIRSLVLQWRFVATMPTMKHAEAVEVEYEEAGEFGEPNSKTVKSYVVRGMTHTHRFVSAVFVLFPRTIIDILLLGVGYRFLVTTTSYSD